MSLLAESLMVTLTCGTEVIPAGLLALLVIFAGLLCWSPLLVFFSGHLC